MKKQHYDTLVEATEELRKQGFTADLQAVEGGIENRSNRTISSVENATIHFSQRFEGMTNPADSSEILAIELDDGTKGILVAAFGAKHSQNTETLKALSR